MHDFLTICIYKAPEEEKYNNIWLKIFEGTNGTLLQSKFNNSIHPLLETYSFTAEKNTDIFFV